MSDIDSMLFLLAARIASAGGHEPKQVLRDVGLRSVELLPGRKLPWGRLVTLCDRIAELAGSDEVVVEWSRSYADLVPRTFRLVFASTITPKALWRFTVEAASWAYPPVLNTVRKLTDTTLDYSVTIKDGYEDSRVFLLGSVGSVAGATRHLGLPDAAVRWDLKPRSVRVRLEIAHAPRARERLRMLGNVLTGAGRLGLLTAEPSAARGYELAPESPRQRALRLAIHDWRLTARQSQVLTLLVEGLANKEIAAQLNCALKTAEHHVTSIIRAAQCQSRAEVGHALWQLAEQYESGQLAPQILTSEFARN